MLIDCIYLWCYSIHKQILTEPNKKRGSATNTSRFTVSHNGATNTRMGKMKGTTITRHQTKPKSPTKNISMWASLVNRNMKLFMSLGIVTLAHFFIL